MPQSLVTPFPLERGAEVIGHMAPDASLVVRCPACGHYTPKVQPDQTHLDPTTGVAAWIDCACYSGHGLPRLAGLPLTDCPCIARYRVQPVASNRFVVQAVDGAAMRERQLAWDAAHVERD